MKTIRAVLLLALVAGFSASVVRAEIYASSESGDFLSTIGPLTSAPEDGDPFIWPVVRLSAFSSHPEAFLNVFGVDRRDGWPSIAISPLTGLPVVVWARYTGHSYDVLMSRWDGLNWSPPQIVAAESMNELDPAVAVDNQGGIHIAWWRQNTPQNQQDEVHYARYDFRGEFVAIDKISSEKRGSEVRPNITVFQGEVWVVFERHLAGGDTEVAVAHRGLQARNWMRERIGQTPSVGPNLDGNVVARIHSTQDRVWVDWIDAPGLMAWSVANARSNDWSTPTYDQYQLNAAPGDSEFMAQESGRARIRLRVIRP